nr:hypothetical protein [uncultured Roseococcus sp.]
MDEDLDALLVAEEQAAFGKSWQIARQSAGPWRDLSGVFDRRHVSSFDAEGAPQSSRHVTLSIRLADLPPGYGEPRPGDQLRRDGASWQISAYEPDAMGGATLTLVVQRGQPSP